MKCAWKLISDILSGKRIRIRNNSTITNQILPLLWALRKHAGALSLSEPQTAVQDQAKCVLPAREAVEAITRTNKGNMYPEHSVSQAAPTPEQSTPSSIHPYSLENEYIMRQC